MNRLQGLRRRLPSTATNNNNALPLRPGCHHVAQCRRRHSAYGFGSQWTGALSRRSLDADEAAELTPPELLAGDTQRLVEMEGSDGVECVAGAAGWGHSALLVRDKKDLSDTAAIATSTRLLVCGRPHDFQTLMRLKRLPSSLRNFCIRHTASNVDEPSSGPSALQKIASYLAGENEVTFHEEQCRAYSNVHTLLEMRLPNGEAPALEGESIEHDLMSLHGRPRYMQQKTHDSDHNQRTPPHHTKFQNTIAASAGLTAVISNKGTLYTFGINHRGQCGIGSFTPNVWTPSPVVGLASLRFVLDYNAHKHQIHDPDGDAPSTSTSTGSNVYKACTVQEFPIVSVALGLQHGIALDSMGQVFCWGKGERGQLGQGRRFAYEALQDHDGNTATAENQYNHDDKWKDLEKEEPNENKTLEYALQVKNFYDPYATLSSATEDIFAPLLSPNDSKIRLVAAGMNFSLAVTESNLPYLWGKNCRHNPSYDSTKINLRSKPVLDSTYPRFVPGLPSAKIVKVACGTHHAAMLLEDGSVWAVGVATDQPIPMWNEAVEILPPNVVDMSSLVSFTAGFDRTFIVYGEEDGSARQVIEIQLWSDEDLRLNGSVRPSWVDWLEEQTQDAQSGKTKKVRSVHRGWMHTVVLTEE
ncbi:hypothetical protein HJC23_010031 [Cyclotella cryptica]|uniref:Uncharacterized protein n=1 Tax=Cyclotella cryptica TaxID=29204 RepID=A0ABD3PS19_9STRA|eukprot:CCRYP_012085-RA/>CCRYP_012085-RA protein AED:0.00 eAED:0.00 QI:30/-1/1/1/-1/1/1/24/640